MVVILYSTVISLINLSITIEVCGSKPLLGSSQNKYFGLSTMALAMPTLFFIPPLNSAGNFLFVSCKFTLAKTSFTRRNFSLKVHLVNMSKENLILSSTVILSNKAEP